MPAKSTSVMSSTVSTTDATSTLIASFDLPSDAPQAMFAVMVMARDTTGASAYESFKWGTVQRVSGVVTFSKTPTDVSGPTVFGLLAGLLSSVGVSFVVSGTTVQVWVKGKLSTALKWRALLRVSYN